MTKYDYEVKLILKERAYFSISTYLGAQELRDWKIHFDRSGGSCLKFARAQNYQILLHLQI